MEFKTITHKLVARICDYCEQHRLSSPGQVRTTKLAYLIECRYYAWEKTRLTDSDWIFWHYGPWSPKLDKILKDDFGIAAEEEPEPGLFRPVLWTKPEFDKPKLRFHPTAEGILLGVLDRFAAMPYNELLDYVYFETEPMRNAVKGKPLDFGPIQKPQRFVDPVSLLPAPVFHKLRERGQQLKLAEPSEELTLDSALSELLAVLDGEALVELPEGEVSMDDKTQLDLRSVSED